jgi:adenylate cyclase
MDNRGAKLTGKAGAPARTDAEAAAGKAAAAEAAAGEPAPSPGPAPLHPRPADAARRTYSGPAEAVARRIEQIVLGGQRRYNRVQVSEITGVSPDRASRLWLAMGFAETGDDQLVFTDSDIEALQVWDGLVTSGTIALEDEVPHARAMGQTLSRLAEWQTREIMARADELAPATDGAELAASAVDMADALLPVVERLQSYVWRRHLAAAADRILLASPGEPSATTMVVGFADIVGYTSLARHYDTAELATLLESFEENTSETVVSHHGRVVKMLGDEVLFVADSPHDAAEIALRLTGPGRAGQGLPPLRVGMATGQVLSRFGDVYGPVVNLAARLTSLARPETVLVDRELAAALRQDQSYELRARRPAAVRGYHHLRSWSLRPRGGRPG